MSEKPDVRLTWEGAATLAALRNLVEARISFELLLPPDYHFALFRHLFPRASPSDPEQIDLSGGAELLDRIAEIQGLTELAELSAAAAAAQARVHIQSPGPGILVCFPSRTESA